MSEFAVGQIIEVVDARFPFAIRGEVLELDEHPLMGPSYAKIRIESPANPAPEGWVNLRTARVIKGLTPSNSAKETK